MASPFESKQEKTLTFTVTDALLSPVGFAILSGAGLFKGASDAERVHVHMAHYATVGSDGKINIEEYAGNDKVLDDAPFFVLTAENGSIIGERIPVTVTTTSNSYVGTVSLVKDADAGSDVVSPILVKNVPLTGTAGSFTIDSSYTPPVNYTVTGATVFQDSAVLRAATTTITVTDVDKYAGSQVFIDYYIEKSAAKVSELQIDAEHFAGNYYVEAETLFRRESDGVDMPAIITLPNVKIQSNFTFSMASTGDPSTFDFTMDALPGFDMCGSALNIA